MNAKKMFFAGVCLLAACFTQAQESQMPKAFSYQAVVRNSQGKVIAKQSVGIKVEILRGSTDGTVVYAETQAPESSQTGTVNLLIGKGTVTEGTFADIDWGAATYFLRISMDVQGGSNYEVVSTTQMLPVPYALYAEKAGSVVNNGGENEIPDNPMSKFILDANGSPLLEKIFEGEIIDDSYVFSGLGFFHLQWTLHYLTGMDEHLDVRITGWPDGAKITNKPRISNDLQRCGSIMVEDIPIGSYQLKLSIVEESGNVLKEYPFTYTVIRD